MTKHELYRKLADEGLFWSYDNSGEYLSDGLLIEHCLLYGEVEDLRELFRLFERDELIDVWNKQVVPDARFEKLNFYLATIWFDIDNAKQYIKENALKYSRYERIKSVTR